MEIRFLKLFLTYCSFLWVSSTFSQNINLNDNIYIDYLSLKVTFNDTFPTQERKALEQLIENEINIFNEKSEKFNVYLVPEIENGRPGIEIRMDDVLYPSKKLQHTTFFITTAGAVTCLAMALSNSPYIIFWWMTSRSEIKHTSYLNASLSEKGQTVLKRRVMGNGGWFKSLPQMRKIIIRNAKSEFRHLLKIIESNYQVPKEYKRIPKQEFDLATTFDEIYNELNLSFAEEYFPTLLSTKKVPKERIKYLPNFNVETGLSFPVSKQFSESFQNGYNIYLGPDWNFNNNISFGISLGSDAFFKPDNGENISKEQLYTFNIGMRFYRTIKFNRTSDFSFAPLIGTYFNYGEYAFKGTLAYDTELVDYKFIFHDLSFIGGIRLSYGQFFSSFYYKYYNPVFEIKDGSEYPYINDNRNINLSCIGVTLGFQF